MPSRPIAFPRQILLVLAALTALVVGGVTASAFASKPATDQQAAEVAAAAGEDPACVTVRISSVDEDWAELYDARNPQCEGADGFVVYQHVDGTWQEAYTGSGPPSCPKELPQAVAIDFKICSGPSKRVYIARGEKLVYKPRTLNQGAHGEYINLRWTGWGTPTAVGHGQLYYSDAYDTFKLPVRITLTTRRPCGEKRTYKHMRVRLLGGSAETKRSLGGSFALGCGYAL